MIRRIKNTVKMTLWPLLPKPWHAVDMEFHYGLWNGVSALFSQSGRQLGEENTRPLALNLHIPAETINCKYSGSRDGRAINISALRIAMKNFDAALAITGAVRDYHLRHRPGGHVPGIWDLFVIARASNALLAYQKRFVRQKAATQSVDDVLASQFQFISGVFMICRHMMEHAHADIAENRPVAADALYRYADEHGIFISFNGMACAGSTKKINDFLAFCNSGGGPLADLADIVSEPDNWYQYALANVELDCFVDAERSHLRETSNTDARAVHQRSARIYSNLGSYVGELMHDRPPVSPSVDFRDGVLMRQNHILQLLGRSPIRHISQRHIEARME